MNEIFVWHPTGSTLKIFMSQAHHQDYVQVDLEEVVMESEEHQQQEEEIEVFQCEHCLKYFSSKSSLKTHLISHTDKYRCPNCEQGFSKKKFLETHIKSPTNCEKLLRVRNLELDQTSWIYPVCLGKSVVITFWYSLRFTTSNIDIMQ